MSCDGCGRSRWSFDLPRSAAASRDCGRGEGEYHLPSNLLDDVADEGGALAQVTLGAGDTGLDDAGGGFLQFWNRPIISFKVHHPQLPREEEGSAEILHEVRLGFSTYVALVDADNQARTGGRFLGHFDGWLWVVVDGDGVKSPVRKSASCKKF